MLPLPQGAGPGPAAPAGAGAGGPMQDKEQVKAMLQSVIQDVRRMAEENGISFDELLSPGGQAPAPPPSLG